jgi:hypothetical protein
MVLLGETLNSIDLTFVSSAPEPGPNSNST